MPTIEERLRRLGHGEFVKNFDLFKACSESGSLRECKLVLSEQVFYDKKKRVLKKLTEKSVNTKCSQGKMIFAEGRQCEALDKVINSEDSEKPLDPLDPNGESVKDRAKKLKRRYCR